MSLSMSLIRTIVTVIHPPATDAGHDSLAVRQARYAIFLALGAGWVSRRVETFEFLDAATVRRRMSVDFTFPRTPNLDPGEKAFVPLMFLAKENLRNLDVLGPDRLPLSVLNTAENGSVAMTGLKSYLEDLVTTAPAIDKEIDVVALDEIVYGRTGNNDRAAERHLAPQDGSLWRQLKHADERKRSEIRTLIEEIDDGFMLLVPLTYQPGERIICKLSYDAANRLERSAPWLDQFFTLTNRFFSSIGWAGRQEFFTNLAVGLGQSYHAEVVPPRDGYVADVALSVRQPGALVDDDEPETDDHDFRPHVRVPPTARTTEGKLKVSIRARRPELLMPLALTSAVISVVLGLLPQNVYQVDPQTLAAMLLVPFALAAYYIRGQENSYITRMLWGVRLLAALPVTCAVYALTLGAIGLLPPAKGTAVSGATLTQIRVLFPISAIATVMLGISMVAPTVGHWPIRPFMRMVEGRAHSALRTHPKSLWRRSVNAVFPVVPAMLVALVAIYGLAYGLELGVTEWLHVAKPS